MYQEQLHRIQQKLSQAKAADKNLEVFGADAHQYHLNPPVSEAEVLAFEKKYGVQLPECYRAFMLTVGDAKAKKSDFIAGPYFGLYAFGTSVDSLLYEKIETYLKAPCNLSPDMTQEEWEKLSDPLLFSEEDEEEDDDKYFAERAKVFGGLLPLGSQGCTYEHALVLNDKYAGRVVNVDLDLAQPKFAFEANFLDWYERYLDEVISGQLLDDRPTWFGYHRGEPAEVLLNEYEHTTDRKTQTDCLEGVYHKKPPLEPALLDKIEKLIALNNDDRDFLIEILSQSSYERAKPYLQDLVNKDPKKVFQFVWWYAKDHCADWVSFVKELLPTITDERTFDFATYLLTEGDDNFEEVILPFTDNENPQIRSTAYYTLGESEKREQYLDTFIKGLQETDTGVLCTVMQALSGVEDKRLLPYYKQIAKRFPEEKDYILSNLEHRLASFGLTIEEARK
ncbi:SMI1/KNR4 family protein [Capnocytophaga genosp. AHN8471]|uniref:SMI1/KNR4 family protein n=1 Tax=Capnocytophaga genosp. AHN8471 TaxID=327574 RepID=A0ABS1YZB5_9FLAO|nr:SMI1/KNR4 family protein [Capnocytophaga genosp. AHN8471]MBM0651511.1 SMI1/KNR4 family protein [Capnocytophaga genosp. AHN8471]MBM0663381.1 SMI1/KNR4 family protein [Capnocytophaga genosp. AHN8471]